MIRSAEGTELGMQVPEQGVFQAERTANSDPKMGM